MAKYRNLEEQQVREKQLLRNQVTMLLQHGKIRTTEAKAKEIRKNRRRSYRFSCKRKR